LPGQRPLRVVVAADSRSLLSATLVDAVVALARMRPGVELVAFCETATGPRLGSSERAGSTIARRLTGRPARQPPLRWTVACAARRASVPLLTPATVNDAGFVAAMGRLRPDVTLSLGCLQLFGRELLAVAGRAVNYHNGALPGYRGLAATAWSIYRGEVETGYAFHVVDEGADTGPVLLEGVVPIGERSLVELERDKLRAAAARLPELFDLLASGSGGTSQPPGGETFTHGAFRAVKRVPDPGALTLEELNRRLRAFEVVTLVLGGSEYEVTALRPARRSRLAFETSDGAHVEPARFLHVPWPAYRLYRTLGGGPRPAA
jgi:methionyl-tRNA formyltransferase